MFLDQTGIFQHSLSLWTQQNIFVWEFELYSNNKAVVNFLSNTKAKVILQRECMTLRLQGYNFNFKKR